MDILCATDEQYAPWCGIMLTSLFENNKEEAFRVFVLTNNLSKHTISLYEQLAKNHNSFIHIIKVDNDLVKGFPIRLHDHVTIAAYYRLLAPVLLPKDIDFILYLDVDLIVNDSISELIKMTNMNDLGMAAVIDEAYYEGKSERLRLDKDVVYFNSGVMLINLSWWRANHVYEKCLNVIRTMPDKLLHHDQDTLNVVFQRNKIILPVTYNMQTGFIEAGIYSHYNETLKAEIRQAMTHPIIIHYSGTNKPWKKRCTHPYAKAFKHYKDLSLWRNEKAIETLFSFRAKLGFYRRRIEIVFGFRGKPFIDCPVEFNFIKGGA